MSSYRYENWWLTWENVVQGLGLDPNVRSFESQRVPGLASIFVREYRGPAGFTGSHPWRYLHVSHEQGYAIDIMFRVPEGLFWAAVDCLENAARREKSENSSCVRCSSVVPCAAETKSSTG